jgi:hypothetical protein
MAFTDYAQYVAESAAPHQHIHTTKNSTTTVAGRTYSSWLTAPFAGATPTTAAAPTSATTGAIPGVQDPTGVMRLVQAEVSMSNSGMLILADRLSHQGGLSGTVLSAQTTNLPTAALTRYTSGVGVFAALEIYSQVGTTGTTVTASYTNTTPTSGRTTVATPFGGTGFREASRLIILPLQEGDVGVTSVESVTIVVSTQTIGNFGVTLFKPLVMLPVMVQGQQFVFDPLLNLAGNLPEIAGDACLQWIFVSSTSSTGIVQASLKLSED